MTTTPPAPPCKRGDVVLVLFPHSNLRTAKLRPALVVQAENLDTGLSQHVVAMITSRLFRANHPSRVIVLRASEEGRQAGLLTDSVVMTDNLATVTDAAIGRVVGTLPMADVDAALRVTLNLQVVAQANRLMLTLGEPVRQQTLLLVLGTAAHCLPTTADTAPPSEGPASGDAPHARHVLAALARQTASRHEAMLCLGGGRSRRNALVAEEVADAR